MLKKKNAKKKFAYLKENGVNIKCCYCDIRGNCKTQKYKEKTEALNIKTYCTLTPNKTKRFLKKNKNKKFGVKH